VGIFKGARVELSDMGTWGQSKGERVRRESGRRDGGWVWLNNFKIIFYGIAATNQTQYNPLRTSSCPPGRLMAGR